MLSSIEPPYGGMPRIFSLQLSTSSGTVNMLSICAPTLCSSESKDGFYEVLETTIKEIPTTEHLFLLGDSYSWPRCIDHFAIGKLNKNGQRLLELCSCDDLFISNRFFSAKPCHRVSWRHSRSCHWHQLDIAITRIPLLNCILLSAVTTAPTVTLTTLLLGAR